MSGRHASWGVVALALAACSSLDDSANDAAPGTSDNGSFGTGGSSATGSSSASGGASATLPPEQEEDLSYRAPVVSGRWVWTANPDTGKVAVVDAKSFAVRLADAGVGPTFLTALPSSANTSRALVINTGSHDATLLSAGATGAVKAVGPIPLQADANAWQVSATGKFAIAWTDSQSLTPDPTQGYQDISVVDLRASTPVATRLVVGFLPSRVFIDDAERRAYIVATSGITVVDLTSAPTPHVLQEEPVTSDPNEDASTRDVSVMPDGSYALIRHEGSNIVTLLDLATGDLSPVSLPGAITDLDLTPDAQSALAVVRGDGVAPIANDGSAGAGGDSAGAAGVAGAVGSPNNGASMLIILPIPGIFSAPTVFDTATVANELFGLVNIAPQGSEALLYTNAIQNSHVTILDTAAGPDYLGHRTVDVHGYVHDVYPSPDGAYAIASLLPTETGGKAGFAAIPVNNALPPRVQTTDAPVFAVAQSTGSAARAVITVSDGVANFAAYIVRMPELVIDTVKLPSRPLANATGLVPDAGVAYIAEENPQGRITFIDLETGVPRTITGFEIAAGVTNGN
jgi:hypothetical protein